MPTICQRNWCTVDAHWQLNNCHTMNSKWIFTVWHRRGFASKHEIMSTANPLTKLFMSSKEQSILTLLTQVHHFSLSFLAAEMLVTAVDFQNTVDYLVSVQRCCWASPAVAPRDGVLTPRRLITSPWMCCLKWLPTPVMQICCYVHKESTRL